LTKQIEDYQQSYDITKTWQNRFINNRDMMMQWKVW